MRKKNLLVPVEWRLLPRRVCKPSSYQLVSCKKNYGKGYIITVLTQLNLVVSHVVRSIPFCDRQIIGLFSRRVKDALEVFDFLVLYIQVIYTYVGYILIYCNIFRSARNGGMLMNFRRTVINTLLKSPRLKRKSLCRTPDQIKPAPKTPKKYFCPSFSLFLFFSRIPIINYAIYFFCLLLFQ